jgi:F0F1-type ATP synthase membrane subunit b/b'
MNDPENPEARTSQTALDAVLEAEEDLKRKVDEAKQLAEERIQAARLAQESRVARETDRITRELADELETRKARLYEELEREANREGELLDKFLADLGPLRTEVQQQIIQAMVGS